MKKLDYFRSETRISILHLISYLYDYVYQVCKSLDDLRIQEFIEILETYLDRGDEALCLSNFLHLNLNSIFNSSKTGTENLNIMIFF